MEKIEISECILKFNLFFLGNREYELTFNCLAANEKFVAKILVSEHLKGYNNGNATATNVILKVDRQIILPNFQS